MSQIRSCIIFTIFSVVLLANISTGYGFKCWLCSSETDKRCGDPFNSTTLLRQEECNPAYYASNANKYVCRKVKHRGSDNEELVSRMCVMDGERENQPCSASQLTSYLRVEHCSTCDTDLCNSAPTLFKITSSILGPIIVLLTKVNIL